MTNNEMLDRYLCSLPRPERIAISLMIREKLGISPYILSFWRRGRTPLKDIYLDKIIEIVGVDIRNRVAI